MNLNENITEQNVLDFLKKLNSNTDKKYDKFYHTIELPFGHKIQGYNRNYEHASWEQISSICNFTNKKVADLGCFNGYFCFEIKKIAKTVHGFDKCIPAIETAKEIAKLKGLEIKFEAFDLDIQEIPEEYDVVLLLNVAHHLKNLELTFSNMFLKAKTVILEMAFEQSRPHWSIISKEELLKIAKKHGHTLKNELSSIRGRTILLFERE